jgi:hypothetical protein
MKELHHNIKTSTALAPVTIDTDTTTEGEVIDTQGFGSTEFAISAGVLADGVFTAVLMESNTVDGGGDMTSETEVVAADLVGDLPSLQNDDGDDSGLTKKVGYKGSKRYVRLDIASTGTDDGGLISAIAIQDSARNAPVS